MRIPGLVKSQNIFSACEYILCFFLEEHYKENQLYIVQKKKLYCKEWEKEFKKRFWDFPENGGINFVLKAVMNARY